MSKLKILLVEDLVLAQTAALAALEDLDCTIDIAETGEQATLQSAAQDYRVILLDIGLPDMDVLTVVEEMRQHQPKNTRIFALTAFGSEELRHRCLEAGMDDFLEKPLTKEMVNEKLGKYVRQTIFS